MKIRNGFVSNSSSSSFIVGIKGTTMRKALKELQEKELKKGGMFSFWVKDVVRIIEDEAKEFNNEFVKDSYGYDNMKNFFADGGNDAGTIQELIDDGYKVYIGSFGDEGTDPVEALLCNTDLNYKTKNFIIIHEGGY